MDGSTAAPEFGQVEYRTSFEPPVARTARDKHRRRRLLLFALRCFIKVEMSPDTAMDQLILPQLPRAAGQPFVTIPLTQLSVVGLTRHDTADSAAIASVKRNPGASVGIAMLSTVVQFRKDMAVATAPVSGTEWALACGADRSAGHFQVNGPTQRPRGRCHCGSIFAILT